VMVVCEKAIKLKHIQKSVIIVFIYLFELIFNAEIYINLTLI
jgi:hypothetical protein